MMNYKVSVILCVYNAIEYVDFALESIANQTYKNIEIIIIDDGSDDGTTIKLDEFVERNKTNEIVYIKQSNMGLTASLNKAISLSSGDYIARMDADDISMPNRIEASLRFLIENNLDLVSTKSTRFNSHGKLSSVPRINKNLISINPNLFKFGNPFVHGSFLIRRSVFDVIGYNETYRTAQDYELLCNMTQHGFKVGYYNKILYNLRVVDNSSGRNKLSTQHNNALAIAKYYYGTSRYMIIDKVGIMKILVSIFKRLYI
ncbi:glycosyltransferase [Vibrio fluvialis]|nr:glycosyltransferase [Vibrio fluvialis]